MIDKFKMNRRDVSQHINTDIVGLVWEVAKLEGINVEVPTLSSIVHVGHVGSCTNVYDIVAINNIKTAWYYISHRGNELELNIDSLKKINSVVGAGIINGCGNLRNYPVRITGTDYRPAPIMTEDYLTKVLREIKRDGKSNTEFCIEVLLRVMKVQAFPDGNKRTAQFIANSLIVRYGTGIISIPIKLQDDFREMLVEFYETDDMKELKEFIYEYCITGAEYRRVGSKHYVEPK